jgi:hypothetical protein
LNCANQGGGFYFGVAPAVISKLPMFIAEPYRRASSVATARP